MELLWESTVRSSIVLSAGLMAVMVLRGRPAALRHWILAAVVVAALVLPALQELLPRWSMPIVWTSDSVGPARPSVEAARESLAAASSGALAPEAGDGVQAVVWVLVIWTAGMVIGLAHLGAGLVRLAWQTAHAEVVAGGRSAELLTRLLHRDAWGRRVRLLYAQGVMPMTWGVRRPVILLPPEADTWSDERLRIVLLHEVAHIRRGDWAIHVASVCLRDVYWFNPLPWFAASRLRTESELACDDLVLAEGIAAPDYATHLLELARLGRVSDAMLPAATIARSSSFERRFRAMLNSDTNRTPVSSRARGISAAAIVGLSLGSATLAAQTFASVSGSVFDATSRVVPSITITLVNLETKALYSIQSGRDGRFQFVGLPPAEYQFEASGPGFEILRGVISVTGQNVEKDLVLGLGELEETVRIVARASAPSTGSEPTIRRAPSRPPAPRCDEAATGGNIRPPVKLVHVTPVYPEVARATGISGAVQLEALIGPDGSVHEVGVVQSQHAALLEATLEAVRQWEFSETLLNCVPSEVRMRVTANYVIEP